MEEKELYRINWKQRYAYVQNHRIVIWKDLCNLEVKPEWIIKRPTKNQWAIDEILRHMFASEIRYIHQSFNPGSLQINEAVAAQWVKERFFRLKENNHVNLKRLKEIALSIENETIKLLDSPNQAYEKRVKAPWGEEMKVFNLLEAFYTHEFYHLGQVYCLLTFFRGLPEIIKSKI
jgi:uncharacterized damage-inducible protein DinB